MSWRIFNDILILARCFRGFNQPVLDNCSAVCCSAADAYHKVLYRVVSCVSFSTGGVLECDISHRRPVSILCMRCKIRCNPMYPLYGALPVPYVYVPVLVTCGALFAHRYIHAPSRCRIPQYRRTFIPLLVSLWNDLDDPVFDGVGLAGFNSKVNPFLLA